MSGPDTQKVRDYAQQLAAIAGDHPLVSDITFDWNEPARVVRVDVLQDKARQLGVTSQDIAGSLNGIVGGTSMTQVRDGIYLVDVVGRARAAERQSIETLQNLQLPGKDGRSVPLAAVATFRYDVEQPVVWRRSRVPTITLKGGIIDATQPATVVQQLEPKVQAFAQELPAGYRVAVAGPVEESGNAQGPIAAVVPLMLFVIATMLMVQLQSFSRLFLVVAVAPLGLIGVVAALLPSGAPMGFVAILGILALIGILIRNSVILVVEIENLRRAGVAAWDAVVEATTHRTRPILLTAAAASLALIPISREVFWGPMAYAMMGGIIVGTVLTLLFLPALYVACFRIKPPSRCETQLAPVDGVREPA
jgi:multidrug efflux pump subunit AcrB